jgi:large subunit ribosomal protein L33
MGDRHIVILGCTVCKNKNYYYQRGKKKEFKLELKKFCRACGKQAPHKEVKSTDSGLVGGMVKWYRLGLQNQSPRFDS